MLLIQALNVINTYALRPPIEDPTVNWEVFIFLYNLILLDDCTWGKAAWWIQKDHSDAVFPKVRGLW